MKMLRRILCLCLAMLSLSFLLAPNPAEAATLSEVDAYVSDIAGPTLVKYDGEWYYVRNGQVDTSTTLVKFNGIWFYVENGKMTPKTTLVEYNGKWFYVENGMLSTKTTLVKYNGDWAYVENGMLSTKTTLCKYGNSWLYVENGRLSTKTTLCKYNGIWFYVENGKMTSKTTLVKYNDDWFYVENGMLSTKTTLYKYGNSWLYVENGMLSTKTTLCKYGNSWLYVENGRLSTKTTLCRYGNSWMYVENGRLSTKTTLCKYNGTWFYVKDGKMSKETALVQYEGKWYYVANGTIQPGVNGEVTVNGNTYYVRNGMLTNCHINGHVYTDATCTAPETCKYCTVINGYALGHLPGDDDYCDECGEYAYVDISTAVGDPGAFCFYNDSDGEITVLWTADNLSGKTIDYYIVTFYYFDSAGDIAYSSVDGTNYATLYYSGPVAPNEELIVYSLVDNVPLCAEIVLGDITILYGDGTVETGWYGWWTTIQDSALADIV